MNSNIFLSIVFLFVFWILFMAGGYAIALLIFRLLHKKPKPQEMKEGIVTLVAGSFIVALVVGWFVFNRLDVEIAIIHPTQAEIQYPPIPPDYVVTVLPVKIPPEPILQDLLSEITYTPDGELNTSSWIEYRSEYGGFSMKAPSLRSEVSEYITNYGPIRYGDSFEYSLSGKSGAYRTVSGFKTYTIIKKDGSNIDNWLDKYIIAGIEDCTNIKKQKVNGYQALVFDRRQIENKVFLIDYATFPNGAYGGGESIAASLSDSTHYTVFDLGNRYVIVYNSTFINNNLYYNFLYSEGYKPKDAPVLLDDKILADIYGAILNSFQTFTPTKP